MSAYLIVRLNVTDMKQYTEYAKLTPAIVEEFGGRFLAVAGQTITLEGPEETSRVVVIEFPSVEQARAFYESPEYQHAITVRAGAATGQFVLVEGVAS